MAQFPILVAPRLTPSPAQVAPLMVVLLGGAKPPARAPQIAL
jgi:hypothetical protein